MSVKVRERKRGRGGLEVDIIVRLPDGTRHRERVASPVSGRTAARRWGEERARHLALHGGARVVRVDASDAAGRLEPAHPPQAVPTLAEFVPDLLVHLRTQLRATTLRTQISIWTHHLLPSLGHLRLDAIDERVCDAYVVDALGREVQRRRHTTLLDPSTVGNHVAVLGKALRVAVRWGLLARVPELHAPIERGRRRTKPADAAFRFLAFDELAAYLRTAQEHAPEWAALLLFAARTGLRLGELLGLDWTHVDLDRRLVRVAVSYTREGGFGPTKTGRTRDVPLARDVVEVLQEHRRRVVATGSRPLVFPLPSDRSRVNTQGCVEYVVGRVARLAGLEHTTPHDLRHTFASHAVMQGVPLRQVQEWLGHSDVRMTERYAHLAPAFGHEMIERLAGRRVVIMASERQRDHAAQDDDADADPE